MREVSIHELRDWLAKRVPPQEGEGGMNLVYIRIGRERRAGLRSEVRTSVDEGDVVLDVDEQGRVYGVEIGIPVDE